MPQSVVIACIDTRNPPETLQAFSGMDVTVHRIIGFHSEEEARLYSQADGIITELHHIGAELIHEFRRCRIIACASTGYDYVDISAAGQRGIWVTNCPGYCTDEVATHTIAMLLSQARRLPQVRQLVQQGLWDPRPVRPLPHVSGQTLGIIGWGRIGKAVSAKAQALGFTVLANDPYVDPNLMEAARVRPADKDTVLRESDYVSLHAPLTPETRHIIDARALSLMKPSAYLINTARGALVDETALLAAVRSGRIVGGAVDVLSVEPPSPDHPLLHDDRILVTPHSAWCSEESDAAVWEWAASEVALVLRGERPRWNINDVD